MFQISTITSTGRSVVSNLFARAPLNADNIVTSCESVSAGASLLSTTKVDVAVGFVGTQSNWDSSMVVHSDVTQTSPSGGAFVDTTRNFTAASLQQGLITVVLKGSPSIFNKFSASNYYLDIEQMSVIHFLDVSRFNSIVALIRAGNAYTISLIPGSERPGLEFTQNVTKLCGAEAASLSCALYTNIYGREVTRPTAVHSMATGINTTSLGATRDWLMGNILKGTDEYSFNLSTNMTRLVRSNFDIDDRVRKAWFLNPGNRWNIPMTNGYQSDLLLSDRLIAVAVITLNDKDGKILRRRLMSFATAAAGNGGGDRPQEQQHVLHSATLPESMRGMHVNGRSLLQDTSQGVYAAEGGYVSVSLRPSQQDPDETTLRDAMQEILKHPKSDPLPAFQFNVDVPKTLTQVYGDELDGGDVSFNVLDFMLYGRFDEWISREDALMQIGNEFFRRLQANIDKICPLCKKIFPVFNNIQVYSDAYAATNDDGVAATTSRRRNLLQQDSNTQQQQQVPSGIVYGTYSVIFIYKDSAANATLLMSDVQRAVFAPNVSSTWNVSVDPNSIGQFVNLLKNNQIILGNLRVMPSESAAQ